LELGLEAGRQTVQIRQNNDEIRRSPVNCLTGKLRFGKADERFW
jgi:hypothetical protein